MIEFKKCMLMFDCALEMNSALNFLPLTLVPSQRLNGLNHWMPRDADPLLEGVNSLFICTQPLMMRFPVLYNFQWKLTQLLLIPVITNTALSSI